MDRRGWKMRDYGEAQDLDELERMLPEGWALKRKKDRNKDHRFWHAENQDTWEKPITGVYFQNVVFRVYYIEVFGEDIPADLKGGFIAKPRGVEPKGTTRKKKSNRTKRNGYRQLEPGENPFVDS